MRVLIRNKKWETYFKNIKLVFEVTGHHEIFYIKFSYNGKQITIKSNNLDKTFRYLEAIFNSMEVDKIPLESRVAG
ncbi:MULTISPECIES: hypothetical protein [Fusobacterium]|jgi:hypothetical protein|uniref:Uncharacterized protein n=1 Tax=Fusobacterium hominis TaxID=2764326 RepID=A0A7G9GUT7_9FUSO|nr:MULTISPECIES: hypothetical protein [Fusobacterium]QNM14569.1 hypothetical protein H9Q81_06160 [Fusobacterium hominis]